MTKAIFLLAATVLCLIGALLLLVVGIILAFRRRMKLCMLSCFTAIALFAFGAFWGGVLTVRSFRAIDKHAHKMAEGRSGEQLFTFAVMKDIPRSVVILHKQDDPFPLGLDPAYWLHFRISPEDLPLVLKQHPYEKVDSISADRLKGMNPPQWWQLDSLGVDAEAYRFYRYRPGDNQKVPWEQAVLWVNKEHSEVYFSLIYY